MVFRVPSLPIFRQLLDTSIFPDVWILSFVTPIYKSGDQDDICNYRPISVLSNLPKLFEYLVVHSIQFPINCILTKEQYGFRPNRSSTHNSIVFNNYIRNVLENCSQVDVIFTDISKSFDQVDRVLLDNILYKLGFGESLLSWFKSYLIMRKQWVKLFNLTILLKTPFPDY